MSEVGRRVREGGKAPGAECPMPMAMPDNLNALNGRHTFIDLFHWAVGTH